MPTSLERPYRENLMLKSLLSYFLASREGTKKKLDFCQTPEPNIPQEEKLDYG